MSKVISEADFVLTLAGALNGVEARCVTGPGRSGAVASVYASHALGIPWIPYGEPCPARIRPLLIIDTAVKSGATLRKAQRKYGDGSFTLALYNEPPRVRFWYERQPRGES